MFFRIFRFKRKQRPAPRSAKASPHSEPLSLPEHPASTAAREPTSVQLSPIIFVSQDSKQVDTYAGRVRISANSGSGIFSPHPGVPRKNRHVSFGAIKDDTKSGLSSSPPTPYPPLSSSPPSSVRLTRESFSSASTLVVDTDQVPPECSAVDAPLWEDVLDEGTPNTAGARTDASAQTQLSLSRGGERPRDKSRHISMLLPLSKRSKASRFSVPVPPSKGLTAQAPSIPPGPSMHTPPSHRTSRRISVMSTASRSGSVKASRSKRASRWSQHVNSPETQEVLKALRNIS
ncbi:hypothetical protein EDD16DRAFT_1524367 [Pisolithus croceorrhizus]|nr:hypothetical protein EV401DRAFT_2079847 [Pisolithus croceorrhizus]KAI6105137.1 hypothetical protein EDD16DRAFT_1524367 [Pisolithus croceorrhizus]KAI6165484.1 hypothetical protein EDD17DRAFT_1505938 [Pisolithus thermaeus]